MYKRCQAQHCPRTAPGSRHASQYEAAQVGEFCEVFNDSKTDPAAWVAKVKKVSKKLFRVSHTACMEVFIDTIARLKLYATGELSIP